MGQRIQGKCGYPCLTPNALHPIAICSAQDALLGIAPLYETRKTYPWQRKSYSGWNTQNSRQMWLSVPLRGRENLTPAGIQGKHGYLYLAPDALVAKILLQLKYVEFKANLVIHALLRMPYSIQQYVLLKMLYFEQYLYTNALLRIAICSAQDALLGIVSIYEAGQIYAMQRIQARKQSYSEYGIWSRTYDYTELFEVSSSYPE